MKNRSLNKQMAAPR